MPMRAIGVKWLKVDPEDRALQVKIEAPEKMLPRGPLPITLAVAGAGANEDAYVTVAAVDVGILNLTRYEPPNPEEWYFGQRQLGLEIREGGRFGVEFDVAGVIHGNGLHLWPFHFRWRARGGQFHFHANAWQCLQVRLLLE